MTREQAVALIRAADALPDELGAGSSFGRYGLPNCALGHLARHLDADVKAKFGLDRAKCRAIMTANDRALPLQRRAEVITEVEHLIAIDGYDPAELRTVRP